MTTMQQTDLDRRVSEHERWFRDNTSGARLELHGADLRGLNLAGRRLSAALLEEVDLSGADLRGAHLYQAGLTQVRLSGAEMTGADLSDAHLRATDLSGATLSGANLAGVIVFDSRFDDTRLNDGFLVKASFTGTRFNNASLANANLLRSYFSESTLTGADLRGADLTRALLSGVDLRGASVAGALFVRTRLDAIRVFGLTGAPGKFRLCTVEAVDFSPAGDGSEVRHGASFLPEALPTYPATLFSPATQSQLQRAGWSERRRFDVASYRQALEDEVFSVFEVVVEFLESFGGLRVFYPDPAGARGWLVLHFDVPEALQHIDRETVFAYEDRIAQPLCVVGSSDNGRTTLMMDDAGRVYGGAEKRLTFLGQSGPQAIEALCSGASPLAEIPEEASSG